MCHLDGAFENNFIIKHFNIDRLGQPESCAVVDDCCITKALWRKPPKKGRRPSWASRNTLWIGWRHYPPHTKHRCPSCGKWYGYLDTALCHIVPWFCLGRFCLMWFCVSAAPSLRSCGWHITSQRTHLSYCGWIFLNTVAYKAGWTNTLFLWEHMLRRRGSHFICIL